MCKFPVLLFTAARNQIKQLLLGVLPLLRPPHPHPHPHLHPHPLDCGATSRENYQLEGLCNHNGKRCPGKGIWNSRTAELQNSRTSGNHSSTHPATEGHPISWVSHRDAWYSNFERGDTFKWVGMVRKWVETFLIPPSPPKLE